MILSSFQLFGQTSTFSGMGDWSDATKWDNGVPDASMDVIIQTISTVTVDIEANCNDFLMSFGTTFIINPGTTLTVSGTSLLDAVAPHTNEGTLVLRGNLDSVNSGTRLTINGGVTSAGGLIFNEGAGSNGLIIK